MNIDVVRVVVTEEERRGTGWSVVLPLARCGRQGKLRRGLQFR
ncbi:hypothetical protein [Mesorhizobium sp. M0814]